MSVPEKIALSGLPRGELEALVERLLAENAALRRVVAELRAEGGTLQGVERRPGGVAEVGGEVATLRGGRRRPEVKPSGMEEAPEPAPAGKSRGGGAKTSKAERLAVDEERVIAAEVPAGSRFEG